MATVGIDLGTTNTLVCINHKGKEKCLRFGAMDSEMLPSCIYVDEEKKIYVGEDAQEEGTLDPENFISSAKTHMGTAWTRECNGISFTPTDVATEILKVVKDKVVDTLGLDEDEVINAVITVPAYFNGSQRDKTRKAGNEAGLNVTKILAEPTAAAVAFIEDSEAEDKVFVVDFGGGTFDLSVLEEDEDENYRACYAPGGDKNLGGDNIDKLLVDGIIKWFRDETDIDLSSFEKSGASDKYEYLSALAKIRREAEKAKIKLSKKSEAEIRIPNFARINGKFEDFNIILNRNRMEAWCEPVFKRVEQLIREYIHKEKINIDEIEHIVLVGGSCYIPKVKEIVETIFGKKTNTSMDLSTMVAKGACIVANSLEGVDGGDGPEFIDVVAHSLGVEVKGKKFVKMLSRGTRISKGEKCFSTKEFTTTYDNQDSISVNVYETADDENETDVRKLSPYGKFVMKNITKARKGEVTIEIRFEYDADGCLVVTSTDKKSGRSVTVEMHGEMWDEPDDDVASIDFALLLDVSDSMGYQTCLYNDQRETSLSSAKRACKKLVNEMINFEQHRMGIIIFGSKTRILSYMNNHKGALESNIDSISGTMGVTVLAEALVDGYKMLSQSSREKVIIVVTDGTPIENTKVATIAAWNSIASKGESMSSNYDQVCVQIAEIIQKKGIRVVIIGVGIDDSGTRLMKRIASSSNGKSDFYLISNMAQLSDTFATVIRDIVEKGAQ